jgi:hypothetical protein
MNNKDKMLQLVLSDENLIRFYEYNPADYPTIQDALDSENPIIVTVAKIIDGVNGSSDKGTFKEIYNEIINYLNQNIL